MQLEGRATIAADRARVWALLADLPAAAECVPGIRGMQVLDPDHVRITAVEAGGARVKIRVDVAQAGRREPDRVELAATGSMRGMRVQARGTVDLLARGPETTDLRWSVEATVSGSLAALGRRGIERATRPLVAQTLRRVEARLREPSAGAPGETAEGARESVLRFRPAWCLFWGMSLSSAQLRIWIPYLRRSRHRFAIMARGDIAQADRDLIDGLPNAIVVEPFEEGREWLRACPGFRGYLYVGTQSGNFGMVNRGRDLAHVFIGHGESGKGTSGFRTASLYDSLFVAEYGVVRRFPRSIRPWVWRGALATGTMVVEDVERARAVGPRPVRSVLYAPTWEGTPRDDYTSLDVVGPVLAGLLPELAARGIEVLLRPHPVTGGRLPGLRDRIDELRAAGAITDLDKGAAFSRADVLIGDVSGVTAEFLLTRKPAIMPVVPKLAAAGRDEAWLDVEYPWMYRWDASPAGLLALLETIGTRDPLRDRRASEARRTFRHHRSIADAVRTFDLALDTLRWRNRPIPLRIPFEAGLLVSRLRDRRVSRSRGR